MIDHLEYNMSHIADKRKAIYLANTKLSMDHWRREKSTLLLVLFALSG